MVASPPTEPRRFPHLRHSPEFGNLTFTKAVRFAVTPWRVRASTLGSSTGTFLVNHEDVWGLVQVQYRDPGDRLWLSQTVRERAAALRAGWAEATFGDFPAIALTVAGWAHEQETRTGPLNLVFARASDFGRRGSAGALLRETLTCDHGHDLDAIRTLAALAGTPIAAP